MFTDSNHAHTHHPPECFRSVWLLRGELPSPYLRGITDLPQWLPPTLLPVKALTSPFSASPSQKPTQHVGHGAYTGVGSGMVPNSENLETASLHNPRGDGHFVAIKTGLELPASKEGLWDTL